MEVARKKNHAMIVQYLADRNGRLAEDVATTALERMNLVAENEATNTLERMNLVAEDVATNTLDRMNLRDLGEELDNLDELAAVIASEKEVLQERHVKENAKTLKNKIQK